MFFKSLKSKKPILRVNFSEFEVSEGPNFFRLENDPKNTWNMFIGSIRNPMQKFGDGPFFFFWPPKIELLPGWISDRVRDIECFKSFDSILPSNLFPSIWRFVIGSLRSKTFPHWLKKLYPEERETSQSGGYDVTLCSSPAFIGRDGRGRAVDWSVKVFPITVFRRSDAAFHIFKVIAHTFEKNKRVRKQEVCVNACNFACVCVHA